MINFEVVFVLVQDAIISLMDVLSILDSLEVEIAPIELNNIIFFGKKFQVIGQLH